jgi:hypothetical protein
MATKPQFASIIREDIAQVTAANTNRDGATGTYVDVVTAPTNGCRVDSIEVTATGTTTAGMIRLFLTDAGGLRRLWREIPVTAVTPSATVQAWSARIATPAGDGTPLLVLAATRKLAASTEKAETFNIVAMGGDFT